MRPDSPTPGVNHVLLTACLCALSVTMLGQGLTLTVDDPRPLASAIAKLEDRFGWVVTYEDPRYRYALDSQDVTEAVRRTSQPGQSRVLVPRGGPFSFVEPSAIRSSLAQEREVLDSLLEQYAATGYPGKFALIRTASAFHVVPTASKNARGAFESYRSILDSRIAQTAGARTALEAVEALATQLGLEVGRMPMPMFRQMRLNQEAANDTGRNLLLGILKTSDRPLSWRVLCPPGDLPCVLNVRMVGQPLQGREP